jgi:hypothetical protein
VAIVPPGELGDDLEHESLEFGIPAELRGVDLPVGHDDPSEIPGLTEWPDARL